MTFHLLKLNNKAIIDQLLLEEDLLRSDNRNWCIINIGSPSAIVMGISSSFEKVIDQKKIIQSQIPVIRRYSGGGTVFVDDDTIFVTFIINQQTIGRNLFPENIHKWAENIYKDAFNFDGFALKENDYVIYDKKFGGNAQYIRKDRCVHHTTFLWDFKKENMDLLLYPPTTPNYRKTRDHSEFLTKLDRYFINKNAFTENLIKTLKKSFSIEDINLEDIKLEKENRRSTKQVI